MRTSAAATRFGPLPTTAQWRLVGAYRWAAWASSSRRASTFSMASARRCSPASSSERHAGSTRQTSAKGDAGRALADDHVSADAPVPEAVGQCAVDGVVTESGEEQSVALLDPSPQRFAEGEGCLGELLEEEVRKVAAVDVARGDRGVAEV